MSVYVDTARNGLGRMVMSHMVADTLAELHAMAVVIGLRREWFQTSPPASFPHYDVAQGRRAAALRLGAVELARADFVRKIRELRNLPEYRDTLLAARHAGKKGGRDGV